MHQRIVILDFGSQVTQLIARRVRELNIYCEIHPWNKIPPMDAQTKGVILSGSPFSVHQPDAPMPDLSSFLGQLPVLGICYGAQLLAQLNGGEVVRSTHREYGRAHLVSRNAATALLKGIPENSQVWMSHGDTILNAGPNATVICSTEDVAVAGYERHDVLAFGLQFHPEVFHSADGTAMIRNFVVDVCIRKLWQP
jgi:GMP synthase (glutamine-hydrolysing)